MRSTSRLLKASPIAFRCSRVSGLEARAGADASLMLDLRFDVRAGGCGFARSMPVLHFCRQEVLSNSPEDVMPRTKVAVPNLAEADPGLWSNGIRAGDFLFISGQVSRPFEGGRTVVGSNEYEQTKHIFSRIKRVCEAAGGSLEDIVKMTIYLVNIKNNTEVWRARRDF